MNILIAPDKFKGSLTAQAVCAAIAAGLRKNYPAATIQFAPLADGGDGTLDILGEYLKLQPRRLSTCDPLGRPMEAVHLISEETAYIEVAAASGLVLLESEARNPLKTSTYGTGIQLKDALENGTKRIFLLLGGSATNDLGLGIAAALGFTFLNAAGKQVEPSGGQLLKIAKIVPPAHRPWEHAEITLLCDVDNPLYGPNGAAHVYATQKGATLAMIETLDQGARHAAKLLAQLTGQTNIGSLPGGGAAGGIGAGLVALLGARIESGFTVIQRLSKLEEKITWADVVITGEGQLDSQSLQGKVVGGVLDLCTEYHKPCHVFTGRNSLPASTAYAATLRGVHEIMSIAPDQQRAMKNASQWLTKLAGGVGLGSVTRSGISK